MRSVPNASQFERPISNQLGDLAILAKPRGHHDWLRDNARVQHEVIQVFIHFPNGKLRGTITAFAARSTGKSKIFTAHCSPLMPEQHALGGIMLRPEKKKSTFGVLAFDEPNDCLDYINRTLQITACDGDWSRIIGNHVT